MVGPAIIPRSMMMIGVVVVVVVRVVLLPPTILPLAPGGMHGRVSLYYTTTLHERSGCDFFVPTAVYR